MAAMSWFETLFGAAPKDPTATPIEEVRAMNDAVKTPWDDAALTTLRALAKTRRDAAQALVDATGTTYGIVRVAWDPEAKSAGFRIVRYSLENEVEARINPRGWSYGGVVSYNAWKQGEAERLKAAIEGPLTYEDSRPLTPILFPAREVAHEWLLAYLSGPDSVRYDAAGVEVC